MEEQKPAFKPTAQEYACIQIRAAIIALQNGKPGDRSDLDRRFAIVITELEKVQAIADAFLRED